MDITFPCKLIAKIIVKCFLFPHIVPLLKMQNKFEHVKLDHSKLHSSPLIYKYKTNLNRLNLKTRVLHFFSFFCLNSPGFKDPISVVVLTVCLIVFALPLMVHLKFAVCWLLSPALKVLFECFPEYILLGQLHHLPILFVVVL